MPRKLLPRWIEIHLLQISRKSYGKLHEHTVNTRPRKIKSVIRNMQIDVLVPGGMHVHIWRDIIVNATQVHLCSGSRMGRVHINVLPSFSSVNFSGISSISNMYLLL